MNIFIQCCNVLTGYNNAMFQGCQTVDAVTHEGIENRESDPTFNGLVGIKSNIQRGQSFPL